MGFDVFFLCIVRDLYDCRRFFVGNSNGDAGLSAVNIAYPIVAVIQALGTGIGMAARSIILLQYSF